MLLHPSLFFKSLLSSLLHYFITIPPSISPLSLFPFSCLPMSSSIIFNSFYLCLACLAYLLSSSSKIKATYTRCFKDQDLIRTKRFMKQGPIHEMVHEARPHTRGDSESRPHTRDGSWSKALYTRWFKNQGLIQELFQRSRPHTLGDSRTKVSHKNCFKDQYIIH